MEPLAPLPAESLTRSTRDQILNAALTTATTHGISRLSVGDVAKAAGLSRQTLYRHFTSKDDLIAAVVVQETSTLIEQVIRAASGFDSPQDSLEAGFLAALIALREHPLLDQLVRTEPDALIPLLTTGGGPVMSQVRGVVELVILMGQPEIDSGHLRRTADLLTRLLISYAVSAPDDSPDVIANFVAASLTPVLTANQPTPKIPNTEVQP